MYAHGGESFATASQRPSRSPRDPQGNFGSTGRSSRVPRVAFASIVAALVVSTMARAEAGDGGSRPPMTEFRFPRYRFPSTPCDKSLKAEQALAAVSGYVFSARWLSSYYGNPQCGEYDAKRSREWLTRAAALGDETAMAQVGYDFKSPYLAVTNVECGDRSIRIETACASYQEDLFHACYSQRLVFGADGLAAEYLFLNRRYRKDPFIIMFGSCVVSGDAGWIVLESGNGGSGMSCNDCERDDYFAVSGEYLGSTPSRTGSVIVGGMKVIPDDVLERVAGAIRVGARVTHFAVLRYPSSPSH